MGVNQVVVLGLDIGCDVRLLRVRTYKVYRGWYGVWTCLERIKESENPFLKFQNS